MAVKIEVELDYGKLREQLREVIREIILEIASEGTPNINISNLSPNPQKIALDIAALMHGRPA